MGCEQAVLPGRRRLPFGHPNAEPTWVIRVRCAVMSGTADDLVERQVAAYNAHDVATFVACYAEDVVIEDGHGGVSVRGRDQLRERYTAFFAAAPEVKAEIVSRIR